VRLILGVLVARTEVNQHEAAGCRIALNAGKYRAAIAQGVMSTRRQADTRGSVPPKVLRGQ